MDWSKIKGFIAWQNSVIDPFFPVFGNFLQILSKEVHFFFGF